MSTYLKIQKLNIENMVKESLEAYKVDQNLELKSQVAVNIFESIIQTAVKEKVSDIHLENKVDSLIVRYRKDGTLFELVELNSKLKDKIINIIKHLSKLDISDTNKPQEGRFSRNIENRKIDFRVSILPIYDGEKVVVRILDKDLFNFNISNIGLNLDSKNYLKETLKQKSGLVLISGPTGSGKTTTLYTILKYLNKEKNNIYTIEDPVEYVMLGVNQIQIDSYKEHEFGKIFKYVLRQDPDIIMVGEIRDYNTAKLVIDASLSGHLVLSTIHSNNCLGAILRLVDMGISEELIINSLIYISSQKVLKKVCKHCGGKPVLNNKYVCDKCFDGYDGRIAVHEILSLDRTYKDNIFRKHFFKNFNYINKFNSELENLLKEGIIDYEEYIKHI